MSTRSITGIISESGPVGYYVHSDGYPDGRLPVLQALIERDGIDKVAETILTARNGGWSYLTVRNDDITNFLGERGEVVEGYGLRYTDQQVKDAPLMKLADARTDIWIEYAYFLNLETGDIEWYDFNEDGDDAPVRIEHTVATKQVREVQVDGTTVIL